MAFVLRKSARPGDPVKPGRRPVPKAPGAVKSPQIPGQVPDRSEVPGEACCRFRLLSTAPPRPSSAPRSYCAHLCPDGRQRGRSARFELGPTSYEERRNAYPALGTPVRPTSGYQLGDGIRLKLARLRGDGRACRGNSLPVSRDVTRLPALRGSAGPFAGAGPVDAANGGAIAGYGYLPAIVMQQVGLRPWCVRQSRATLPRACHKSSHRSCPHATRRRRRLVDHLSRRPHHGNHETHDQAGGATELPASSARRRARPRSAPSKCLSSIARWWKSASSKTPASVPSGRARSVATSTLTLARRPSPPDFSTNTKG